MYKPPTVRKLPRSQSTSNNNKNTNTNPPNANSFATNNNNPNLNNINPNKQLVNSYKNISSKINSNFNKEKRELSQQKRKPINNREVPSKPPLNNKNINNNHHQTIPQKVQKLQKAINKLQNNVGNQEMQQILIRQIQGIKSQLHQIKEKIGIKTVNSNIKYQNFKDSDRNMNTNKSYQNYENQQRYQDEQGLQENIYNIGQNQSQAHHNLQQSHHQKYQEKIIPKANYSNMNLKNVHKKQILQVGKIQPYLKQFKLLDNTPGQMLPFYRGYHKKSSKPVVIKYCSDSMSMEPILSLYERLWKNIVKAKYGVCINKIYDINQPLAHNILVMEQNKFGLSQILMNTQEAGGKSSTFKSYKEVIVQILRSLQFFHQCGYLYRNIRPQHIMMNYNGQIVLIDLKRMRKFVDPRGKLMQVRRFQGNQQHQQNFNELEKIRNSVDEFSSNSQLTFNAQGRKDDLQSLGYLSLFILQGKLPWTYDVQSMLKMRPKLTLQQLYGRYQNLLNYMISVHKMSFDECPNYDKLAAILLQ